ncbi:LytR/AlgR family response regulator transcription factor [Maribacter sp. 2-571]|uniref:LytR/AlgR family response regulator transcription factor n=1 Tax=Maribacter sp. 2-571 TaxID=3417569 RepID=UPI003D346260
MNTPLQCIIIEDELPAQRILKNYLGKLPDMELKGSFQSALEANEMLRNNSIDAVFLDINLPDISGLHYIKTLSRAPAIVMTTAYPEHAVESFELDTICDYLVKPFSFERFLKAVHKIRNRTPIVVEASRPKALGHVFINVDKTLHKVALGSILYIESDRNYVTVVTESGKLSYLESLKNWLKRVPKTQFLQVHKSYIVNCAHIDKITGNTLYINGNKIPIGRMFKSNLRTTLSTMEREHRHP